MKNHHLIFACICVFFSLNQMATAAGHGPAKPAKKRTVANLSFKNINFAFNKTEIPKDSYAELDRCAKLITGNHVALKVAGYADNRGGYVYNWKLSQKRAAAVKQFLVLKGADSSKIAVTEFGFTHPIASNKTAAGRKKNRRVELHVAD
jgi:OOP family OmpA-OmpF porin